MFSKHYVASPNGLLSEKSMIPSASVSISALKAPASVGNSFAGGGGLEFGLLDLSGNIIAALDRDASGTFNAGDLALDVQDNVTSVSYNASNDVFTFIA